MDFLKAPFSMTVSLNDAFSATQSSDLTSPHLLPQSRLGIASHGLETAVDRTIDGLVKRMVVGHWY